MKKKSKTIEVNETFESLTQVFVFAFLVIFPLFTGTRKNYVNITKSKFVYFLILSFMFLISYVYYAIKERKNLKKSDYQLDITGYALILYLFWTVVIDFASPYNWKLKFIGLPRYEALFSLLTYGFLFLMIYFSGKHLDETLYGVAVMGIIVGAISTAQCFGAKLLYPNDYTFFNSSFLGTIGNMDCYSGFISMIIPVLFCSYVFLDKKKPYLTLPAIFLLMYAQLFCDVDSGKIGLLTAFAFALPFVFDSSEHMARGLQGFGVFMLSFAFYRLFKGTNLEKVHWNFNKIFFISLILAVLLYVAGYYLEKKKIKYPGKKTMRIAVTVLIVVFVIAALIFIYNYKGGYNLLKEASKLLHGTLTDEMGTYRGYIWKKSFELIKQSPVIGYGTGSFVEVFRPYNTTPNVTYDFAHNDFVQIAVCQGLGGLLIYLTFVISLIIKGVVSSCKNETTIIYLCGAVGFLAHTLFGFSIAIVSPVFWVLAAMTARLSK